MNDAPAPSRQMLNVDLAIVGGGIMGLWAAYLAEKAGVDTLLIDNGGPTTSQGLLGALMAYMPDQWDGKKAFQFKALTGLEGELRLLEEETGLSTGYRRSGRVMPLYTDQQVATARLRADAADVNWRAAGARWAVVETPPVPDWPVSDGAALAYVHETFAAHVFPRAVMAALQTFLANARHVRRIDATVAGIEAAENTLRLADGSSIGFAKAIVSAGVGAFPLLQPLWAPTGLPLGRPVKGQAALLAAECDPGLPIFFDNGLYVIAHPGGRVAIGSTSEDTFEKPHETDGKLDALIAAARRAVPALADATVVERWAGLRPRGVHREPMVGAIEAFPDIIALGGGFKTSFGIARRLAGHAIGLASGVTPAGEGLPDIYDLRFYLQRANKSPK
ncbi:NAD(P)/FAD-dependent oxidoreductase [Martelella endophytica]|uniref:D-amino acid oxidase n=1 Tax=Martelella endophytica TaxID=1486262 RepID=A0A0D5LLV7_MAREN|nr:FAD-dependent oxidoreductase [Martelella endophytica]AJY44757.1 D-amino acid oxidase [Martelella endophytica]